MERAGDGVVVVVGHDFHVRGKGVGGVCLFDRVCWWRELSGGRAVLLSLLVFGVLVSAVVRLVLVLKAL